MTEKNKLGLALLFILTLMGLTLIHLVIIVKYPPEDSVVTQLSCWEGNNSPITIYIKREIPIEDYPIITIKCPQKEDEVQRSALKDNKK